MTTTTPRRAPALPMTDDDHFTPDPDAIVAHPLRTYLALARHYPLLTAEQERELASRIATATRPDEAHAAHQQLVLAHLRLVVHVARRYRSPGLTLLDLIQEGNIGLMRAGWTFDPTRGTRFAAYAAWRIQQRISRAVWSKARLIHLPELVRERHRAARQAADRLCQTLGREPSTQEIAAATGHSPTQIQEALMAAPDSLDRLLTVDGGALEALVADPQAVAPEDAAEQRALRTALAQALSGLSPRERRVLELHYGLQGQEPQSYRQIGPLLGISAQAVYQVEQQALGKLRTVAHRLDLCAFLDLPTPAPRAPQAAQGLPGEPRIRRLTPGARPAAPVPTLPATLPPGLPRGLAAVFAALTEAPTLETAARRSGYSRAQFHRILAEAWRTLGLPERQGQHRPVQLAQELSKALRTRQRRRLARTA